MVANQPLKKRQMTSYKIPLENGSFSDDNRNMNYNCLL